MVVRLAVRHGGLVGIAAALLLLQGCDPPDSGVRETFSTSPLLVVNAWDRAPVETFCLEGIETYDRVPNSMTPFADAIESILTRAYRGSAPAQLVEASCDFTITIDIGGRALLGNYMNVGGLYTGWDVSGTITLTAERRSPLVVRVESRKAPPSRTVDDRASAGQPWTAIRDAAEETGADWRASFSDLFTCSLDGCLSH